MVNFGRHRLSYRVIPEENDWIRLEVHHKNQGVRKEIETHLDDPRWFLRHVAANHGGIMAKKHLKEIVSRFKSHFQTGRVSIILMGGHDESPTAVLFRGGRQTVKIPQTLQQSKGQTLTKQVTSCLMQKLMLEFSECWIGREERHPSGLSYSFSPEEPYQRLSLRRFNQVWKWTSDASPQVRDCLKRGICADVTHHLEQSRRFYKERTNQKGENFKPDITMYRRESSTIFFIHFEVNRMNPWENLRLMWAFSMRHPERRIRFLQWLSQYNNPGFQFRKEYWLARVLGEAVGWPANFSYRAVILEKVYQNDEPSDEEVDEICRRLLREVKALMSI